MSDSIQLSDILDVLRDYKQRKHAKTGIYNTPFIVIYSDYSGHINLGGVKKKELIFLGLDDAYKKAKKLTAEQRTMTLDDFKYQPIRRVWINCPSASQLHHSLHGKVGIATIKRGTTARIYFTEGDVISMDIDVSYLAVKN